MIPLLSASRPRIARLLFLLSCVASPALASPADPPALSQPLTLEQCLQLAAQAPPVALSQQAQRLEGTALVAQARALPNPTVTYVAQDLGLHGAAGPLLLHQATIGFPPLLALLQIQASRAARAGQQQSLAAAQVDLLQLRSAVGQAFYDLLLLEKLVAVEQEAVVLAGQLVRDAEVRKQSGDTGGLDVLRAQAEALDVQRGAQAVVHQRTLAQLAFSTLLGAAIPSLVQLREEPDVGFEQLPPPLRAVLDPVSPHDLAGQLAALVQLALASRPELRQYTAAHQQLEALAHWEHLRALPLVDLHISAGVRSSSVGTGAVLSLVGSLPLFDWRTGLRDRLHAQALQAHVHSLQAAQRISLEVQTSYRDWNLARQLHAQHALPARDLRTRLLAITRKQFTEGLVVLSDVVQAHRELLAAQRARCHIERDAWVARWRLLVATSL